MQSLDCMFNYEFLKEKITRYQEDSGMEVRLKLKLTPQPKSAF
jgi:hypothetical protein